MRTIGLICVYGKSSKPKARCSNPQDQGKLCKVNITTDATTKQSCAPKAYRPIELNQQIFIALNYVQFAQILMLAIQTDREIIGQKIAVISNESDSQEFRIMDLI